MSLLVVLLLAWCLVGDRLRARCWPGWLPWTLRAALALALGTTFAGTMMFVVRRGDGSNTTLVVGSLLAMGLVEVVARRVLPVAAVVAGIRTLPAAVPQPRAATVLVVLAVVVAAVGYVIEAMRYPLGGIDAVVLWNVRGRLLALDGVHWALRLVDIAASPHADYPLLLPGVLAYVVPGVEVTHWPSAFVAALYTAGVLAATHGFVQVVAGQRAASVALLCLLATSRVWKVGVQQFADVPVAFYAIAGWGCLFVAMRAGTAARRVAWLGGLLLGAAAWTKNEGQALLIVTVVAFGIATWWGGRPRELRSIGGALLAGAAPMLAVWLFHRFDFPAVNEFAVRPAGATVAMLLQPGRHVLACRVFGKELVAFGGGMLLIVPALAVLARWRRQRPDPSTRAARWCLACVLVALLVLYHVVFVVTPHDQSWHVTVAAPRLLTQLLPMFLLLFCPLGPFADGLVPAARGEQE